MVSPLSPAKSALKTLWLDFDAMKIIICFPFNSIPIYFVDCIFLQRYFVSKIMFHTFLPCLYIVHTDSFVSYHHACLPENVQTALHKTVTTLEFYWQQV